MSKCKLCDKPARAKGLCLTHYRSEKTKTREEALRTVITRAEDIKMRRPDLAPLIEELIAEAKPLFREFRPKKTNAAEEIAEMRKELNELKRRLPPS